MMNRLVSSRVWRRRLLEWLEAARPQTVAPAPDPIGDNLRAAVAAEERALRENMQTYQTRVETMIDDFFVRYGEHHVRPHS